MSNPIIPDYKILKLGSPTDVEKKSVEAWISQGGSRAAAEFLGVTHGCVVRAAGRVMKKAKIAGYDPRPIIEPDKEVSAKNSNRVDKKLSHKVPTYVVTWAQNAT